jgi:hypothetical protein
MMSPYVHSCSQAVVYAGIWPVGLPAVWGAAGGAHVEAFCEGLVQPRNRRVRVGGHQVAGAVPAGCRGAQRIRGLQETGRVGAELALLCGMGARMLGGC